MVLSTAPYVSSLQNIFPIRTTFNPNNTFEDVSNRSLTPLKMLLVHDRHRLKCRFCQAKQQTRWKRSMPRFRSRMQDPDTKNPRQPVSLCSLLLTFQSQKEGNPRLHIHEANRTCQDNFGWSFEACLCSDSHLLSKTLISLRSLSISDNNRQTGPVSDRGIPNSSSSG